MSLSEKKSQPNISEAASEGYTLIEVIVTMFIMGLILLVVNVIMISIIRVAFNTDTRIKVRQGLEFSMEVVRRNTKSADPARVTIVPADPPNGMPNDGLGMRLAEGDDQVVFMRSIDTVSGNGMIIAHWTINGVTNDILLTSPDQINVEDFTVQKNDDVLSGTSEVVISIWASSAHMKNASEPLVDDIYKQEVLIIRYRDL